MSSAHVSGLRYVSDQDPGIQRRRAGRGFQYLTPARTILRDARQLKRIQALVIPPAWTNVWICATPDGHLQAAGRDNRGRKQYRYHSLYRQIRDQTKFSRMTAFAAVLPGIRRRVEADLNAPGLTKTKVVATLVKLLDSTGIRVGNEEYVQQNESFGLTTLRDRHVKIAQQTLRFRFKGKSGQVHEVMFTDRKVARIVHDCQCLPGQELFQYLDEEGSPSAVRSEDVNDYLREVSGDEFTAKDFRTWIGTTETVLALEALGPAENATENKKHICEAIKIVARKLGNRPATCRAYYVHPAIPEAYANGTFFDIVQTCSRKYSKLNGDRPLLRREEVCALGLIESSASSGHGSVKP